MLSGEDIIICNDVHKWFGEFHVLQGITTTVKEGEVVVIIGPSGSGKSTWIRTLNRLETDSGGNNTQPQADDPGQGHS